MKHAVEELITIARQYFPRGIEPHEAGYDATPEIRRQIEARARASGQYEAFRGLLRRLDERLGGTSVENRSYFLQSPDGAGLDRCFDVLVDLPLRRPEERRHGLEILISFVVPYYVLYSVHGVPGGGDYPALGFSFTLSEDEAPVARRIEGEVLAAFPGYEALPEDVARTVVPGIIVHPEVPATLLGCLFSDDWLNRRASLSPSPHGP